MDTNVGMQTITPLILLALYHCFFWAYSWAIWCSVKYFMTFWTQKKFNNVFEENRNVILKGTKC
jgi:hypothetical protein